MRRPRDVPWDVSANSPCGALTALTKPNQLKAHVRGALANGVRATEIREVIMHTAVYSGIPSGVEALNAAAEVLGDEAR